MERRKFPNSVGAEYDVYNAQGGYIYYYPEDVEKMRQMPEDEKTEYKLHLLENGRYETVSFDKM